MALTVTVTPNETWPDGSTITYAKLRATAKPTVSVSGSVGTSDIASCAVTDAKVKTGAYWYAAAGGTANALTVTTGCPAAALTAGLVAAFKATATNTTAVTINVDGLGAVALKKYGTTALGPGDILNGGIYEIRYDGSVWQLCSPVATAVDGNGGANPISSGGDPTAGTGAFFKGVFTSIQGTPTTTVHTAGDTDVVMGSCTLTLPAGKTWTWSEVHFATSINSLGGLNLFKVKIGSTAQTILTTFASNLANNSDDAIGYYVVAQGVPSTTNASITLDVTAQRPNPTTVQYQKQPAAVTTGTASYGDDPYRRTLYAMGYYI